MAESVPVQLYVYDMTNGVASVMSQMLLGQRIDGIWHTGVVVFGKEWFFGSSGIQSCMPVILSHKHCVFFRKEILSIYKYRCSVRANTYALVVFCLFVFFMRVEFECKRRNVNTENQCNLPINA